MTLEKAVRRSLVGGLMVLIVGSAVLDTARCAEAGEAYVMIANLTNFKKANASIDVTLDTAIDVTFLGANFDVFDRAGGYAASFSVTFDEKGFASSASAAPPYDNLFTAGDGSPTLVRVRTDSSFTLFSVTLQQQFQQSRLVLGVPPSRRSDGIAVGMGQVFVVNPGDIRHRATLLIANVSGSDVNVDVHLGTRGPVGAGAYSNPLLTNRTIWVVEIDPAHANTNLVVVSSGDAVAQLIVDEGKKNALTGVTLLPF